MEGAEIKVYVLSLQMNQNTSITDSTCPKMFVLK